MIDILRNYRWTITLACFVVVALVVAISSWTRLYHEKQNCRDGVMVRTLTGYECVERSQ